MKIFFLFLSATIMFGCHSFAQSKITEFNILQAKSLDIPVEYKETGDANYDDLIYRRDLIRYFRSEFKMPEFSRTGEKEKDIADFNIKIKLWYQQYPQFVDVLNLRNYDQFYRYDASCYDTPPIYAKGCSDAEEKAYQKRFNNWMAHHPDVPKLTCDDQAAKDKHEREKAEFYAKYYKQ